MKQEDFFNLGFHSKESFTIYSRKEPEFATIVRKIICKCDLLRSEKLGDLRKDYYKEIDSFEEKIELRKYVVSKHYQYSKRTEDLKKNKEYLKMTKKDADDFGFTTLRSLKEFMDDNLKFRTVVIKVVNECDVIRKEKLNNVRKKYFKEIDSHEMESYLKKRAKAREEAKAKKLLTQNHDICDQTLL